MLYYTVINYFSRRVKMEFKIQMEKCMITGVNGFVAKHFIEYLNKNNIDFDILGLDISDGTDMDIQYKKVDLIDKSAIFGILKEYKGPPDPLRGDEIYKRVRDAARVSLGTLSFVCAMICKTPFNRKH